MPIAAPICSSLIDRRWWRLFTVVVVVVAVVPVVETTKMQTQFHEHTEAHYRRQIALPGE